MVYSIPSHSYILFEGFLDPKMRDMMEAFHLGPTIWLCVSYLYSSAAEESFSDDG